MPDFAKNPGGFGAGATANNDPVYLAVLEEYATGSVSVKTSIPLDMILTTVQFIGFRRFEARPHCKSTGLQRDLAKLGTSDSDSDFGP